MIEYTIIITEGEHPEFTYLATMSDYDGAPDGNNFYGVGDSHQEAAEDLVNNYNNWSDEQ